MMENQIFLCTYLCFIIVFRHKYITFVSHMPTC